MSHLGIRDVCCFECELLTKAAVVLRSLLMTSTKKLAHERNIECQTANVMSAFTAGFLFSPNVNTHSAKNINYLKSKKGNGSVNFISISTDWATVISLPSRSPLK